MEGQEAELDSLLHQAVEEQISRSRCAAVELEYHSLWSLD